MSAPEGHSENIKTISGDNKYQFPCGDGGALGSDQIEEGLTAALRKLDEFLINKKKVLVFCQQGKDRSATVVMAYLMERYQVTREEAYNFVKSKRLVAAGGKGAMQCYWEKILGNLGQVLAADIEEEES